VSDSDNGSVPPEDSIPSPEGQMPIAIEEEMRRSYLDYAMSVIVSRALPDARDGLKPVHRRILFSMNENGFTNDKPYKKSARVVGDVMGKYHPHGDSAIYDAMVRMAQTFSLRVPLIDGQGNFGSMDGDPPAAMRYTEARLAKSATALLEGIDEDTIDFQPNYDESAEEPRVLPAAFPNLLVNGANGIAVGMATNIPPHNPTEVIDATLKLIAEPDTALDELMKIIPGPDFPTGALIIGRSGIRSAFETGRGSVILRARAEVEEMRGGRSCIAISEIPYQVNKSSLIERIADLVRTKQLEGISDLRDESDPLRPAHRGGAEEGCDAGSGAEPPLPVHAAPDLGRREYAGAGRGPPRADGADLRTEGLYPVPGGGDPPPLPLPAGQGAGPRAPVDRPVHRGRQYRRGDPPDPREQRRRRRPRCADGAGLAGGRHRPAAGAGGRCRQHRARGHGEADRGPGARHPGAAPAPPNRAGAGKDHRRAGRGRRPHP
jgi:hypothetical protein